MPAEPTLTPDEAFAELARWANEREGRTFRIGHRTNWVTNGPERVALVAIEELFAPGHGLPWDEVLGVYSVEAPTLSEALATMVATLPPDAPE